ncbi:MAG: c-type cytochrome [Cellvibrionales bacterium]|nr:c-type cytochrome [Cellvibrionales bacterium]
MLPLYRSISRTLGLVMSLALFSLSYQAAALSEQKRAAISDRIKPVGEVCLQGEECAKNLTVAKSGGEPRSGEQVFNTFCTACHTSGAAGAPIKGNAGQWKDRLAKGLDTLYTNATNGVGAMPAKGLCSDCSDDEIKAAVDFMLP